MSRQASKKSFKNSRLHRNVYVHYLSSKCQMGCRTIALYEPLSKNRSLQKAKVRGVLDEKWCCILPNRNNGHWFIAQQTLTLASVNLYKSRRWLCRLSWHCSLPFNRLPSAILHLLLFYHLNLRLYRLYSCHISILLNLEGQRWGAVSLALG